ncbi:WG repeat-containing protein [Flavobacterium sp.]|uniref:WG repeat-containing protein n=1 Tax=Flavobacterium sp. TaxID=239 RepID=UPI0032635CEE
MKKNKFLVLFVALLISYQTISQKKYGFINLKNEVVIPAKFDGAQNFKNGLAAVKIGDLWGFINTKGEIVIQPKYGTVLDFDDPIAKVSIKEIGFMQTGTYTYINQKGEDVPEASILGEPAFFNGLKPAIAENGKYGYKNNKGIMVIPAIYDNANEFNGSGWATCYKDGFMGCVNASGKVVLPFTFKFIQTGFGKYIAAQTQNGECRIYNSDDGTFIKIAGVNDIYAFEKSGITTFKSGNKFGFINTKGKILCPAIYDHTSTNNEGLVKVFTNGQLQVYDILNNKILATIPNAKGYGTISNGITQINIDDKCGFIDKYGKTIIPAQYYNLGDLFENGLTYFQTDGTAQASNAVASNTTVLQSNSVEQNTSNHNAGTLISINPDGTNQGEVQHKNKELVYITENSGQWTSVKLNQEKEAITAMLKSGLYTESDFNKISDLASENTYPIAIKNYELRVQNMHLARNYKCIRIAQFTTSYAPYSVLWIPKEDNKNLPAEMQPTSDNGFYIVMKTSSVSTIPNPSSDNQVRGDMTQPQSYKIGNITVSTYALDRFSVLGAMAIIRGSTMYVVKIKGKTMQDEGIVAARANKVLGFDSAFKYQWFSGSNCITLQSQYGRAFTVICQGEVDLDK